jgi:hypothetical protein
MNDTNNTFRSWEQLTRREQLLSQISDTYKDINGIRPRWNMDHLSDDDLQKWLDDMFVDLRSQMEQERADELAHEAAVKKALTPKTFTLGMVWA